MEKSFHNGLFMGANFNRVGSYTSQVESGTGVIAGDYNVLNAHLGYRTRHYTIRFYTKNLTNENILYSGRTNWAGLQAQIGQPRAFGFTIDGRL
ncbi:TonB-dependent receptor [Asaia prunellae]|uniref:TonB-dependent receptor n=1 Tax=Asaia prunellae TaxID=610245 RepID=UPI00046FEB8D